MRSTSAVLALIVACAGTTAALTVRMPYAGESPVVARIGLSAVAGSGIESDIDIDSRVASLVAAGGGKINAATYGTSRGGRQLHVLRLGDEGKPALLIVAGLNPQHRVGIEAALGVAKKLAEQPGDLLSTHTIYIMPCADPDGIERERTATLKRDGSRTVAPVDDDHDGRIDEDGPKDLNGDGVITTMRIPDPAPGFGLEATDMLDPTDARLTKKPDRNKGERAVYATVIEGEDQDGDGLIAEDGIDGTDMTRNFPYHWPEFGEGAGPYPLSEPETRAIAEWVMTHNTLLSVLVFGPHDNLVNVPEAGKMDQTQRIPNGIENEDKWAFDEVSKVFKDATGMTGATAGDNAGSLHGWTYGFLGLYSFSTPVWVRPDLVTKKDGPAAAPPADDAKPAEPAPAAPAQPGAMSDAEIQAAIAEFRSASPERRRELMARTLTLPQETQDKLRAAAMAAFADGVPPSPAATSTAQPAAVQTATTPTAPPAAPAAGQPEGGLPPGGGRGGRGPGTGGGRGGRGQFGPGGPGGGPGGPRDGGASRAPVSDADDAKWLKYSDDQRAKSGFIEFKPFNHPQLGSVEIGGFAPGFKLNPPDADIPALVDQQTKFITELLGKMPRLEVAEPIVGNLGPGLWKVRMEVSNEGLLPTRSAMANKARRLPPVRIVLGLPEESVVSGERTTRVPTLVGSGGSRSVEWIVAQPENSTVNVTIKSVEFGDRTIAIPMKAQARKQKVPPPPTPPPTPPPPSPATTPPSPSPAAPAGDKPSEGKPSASAVGVKSATSESGAKETSR